MQVIITSDLHFTDRDIDSYRFEIFPFLHKEAGDNKDKILTILGDITDYKDNHSSRLVNKLVHNLHTLSLAYKEVILLLGNHDYLDQGEPYLDFLNFFPNISYIWDKPTERNFGSKRAIFLPHTRKPEDDWVFIDLRSYHYIFMHQTMTGSVVSNGAKMEEGLSKTFFSGTNKSMKIFSGDIHVPQRINRVTYVGSPYGVRFGDCYQPRIIELDTDTGEFFSIDTEFPRKIQLDFVLPVMHNESGYRKKLLKIFEEVGVRKGDMVKLKVRLTSGKYKLWDTAKVFLRRIVEGEGIKLSSMEVYGNVVEKEESFKKSYQIVSTMDKLKTVERFARSNKLGKSLTETGRGIVENEQ